MTHVSRQQVLGRVVRLEVGGLVRDEPVAVGVALVEGVVGELLDDVEPLRAQLARRTPWPRTLRRTSRAPWRSAPGPSCRSCGPGSPRRPRTAARRSPSGSRSTPSRPTYSTDTTVSHTRSPVREILEALRVQEASERLAVQHPRRRCSRRSRRPSDRFDRPVTAARRSSSCGEERRRDPDVRGAGAIRPLVHPASDLGVLDRGQMRFDLAREPLGHALVGDRQRPVGAVAGDLARVEVRRRRRSGAASA